MTPAESFAAAEGISPADVTHCVLIGRRGDLQVYAVGYWSWFASYTVYTHGTIELCSDGTWGKMRYTQEMDVERITETQAEAIPSKTP